jgi:1-acyl-sn-glycerol-3-phosphate acyltransferase
VLRLVLRFVWLVVVVHGCVFHLILRAMWRCLIRRPFPAQQRAQVLHQWSRHALRATGTTSKISGRRPVGGVLVSNHLSYLDILLLAAAAPVVFVSKKEVRAYPLIGRVAALAGTIFIDRKKSMATQAVASEMDEALRGGCCVAFFPEGTTTGGGELLRFHAGLFADPIRLGVPVHTAAIRYVVQGGDSSELVCFWKDHVMLPHLLRLLMLPGVEATLQYGPSFIPEPGPHPAASRAAANRAQGIVREMLVRMGSLAE